jgi:two-component system sensor histidine kinase UhpB
MTNALRVLIVEDSESDSGLIVRHLERAGYVLIHERVETAEAMKTALGKEDWDIVIADYSMPRFDALAALRILQESGWDIPFIVVSGHIGEDLAVALMKAGAHDYMMKDNLARLIPAVHRELGDAEVRKKRRVAEEALRESEQMLKLVLDTIPARVFWKDLASNYLGCNRPFALDAGLQSPEEIVNRNDFELGWAEQAELYRSDDRLVMETGIPKLGYEEPETTPHGRIWVRTSKVPLLNAKGEIKGMLGTYEDVTAHKRAEEELREAHHELERRVVERTAALGKANEELRQFPSKLIAVQEEERRRLASELHDSIGQTLAAVKFWVETALKLKDAGDVNSALNQLEQFVPILQRSIEETRNIYMGLRPSMLDSHGLLTTLEWLRQECMKLYPERHIELEAGIAEEEIPKGLKVSIFRIAQEALNNIAKHSNAEWVDISLSKNVGGIQLVVSDDGVGMDQDLILQTGAAKGLGLASMRERAELSRGSFSIESTPCHGTTIRVYWPIEAEDQLQKNDNT